MAVNERWLTVAMLAAIALLFLLFLGSVDIFDPEEGRHASIPVAMLRTGDFVVPHLQGFPYLEKPPLTYWMTAASFNILGRTEFAARLPVALMGFVGVLAVFWLTRNRMGIRVAWIAAGVLTLTTQWFVESRYLTTDMILAGWMTLALAAFWIAATTGRRSLYWVFWGAMALATLSKGIIGFLLPAMIIGLFIALTGRWRMVREMRLPSGVAMMALVVLPWFFLVQARLPDFFRYFIFDQHVSRYVGAAAEHSKPIWFFLPVMMFGFFPWVAYLPFLPRRRDPGHAVGEASRWAPLAGARADTVFLWLWFGVIFLFFSASRGKLMPYVLPAYPPLAILAAELFAGLWDPAGRAEATRGIRRGTWIVAGIYLFLAPAVVVAMNRLSERDKRMSTEELGFWPWAVVGLFGLGGIVLLAATWFRRPVAALACLAVTQVAFYVVVIGTARTADPFLGTGVLGEALAEVARPEDRIVLYELQQPSMEFYLNRVPTLVNWVGEYGYGMRIQPDPELFDPDPDSIREIMDTEQTVYVLVKRRESSMPEAFGVPVRLVAQNRKRMMYRNHPERP